MDVCLCACVLHTHVYMLSPCNEKRVGGELIYVCSGPKLCDLGIYVIELSVCLNYSLVLCVNVFYSSRTKNSLYLPIATSMPNSQIFLCKVS